MTKAMLIESRALNNHICLPSKPYPQKSWILSMKAKTPLTPKSLATRYLSTSLNMNELNIRRVLLSVFFGYEIDQERYRCYELETRHVITMNCDFLKRDYFYHHLSGKGKSEIE